MPLFVGPTFHEWKETCLSVKSPTFRSLNTMFQIARAILGILAMWFSAWGDSDDPLLFLLLSIVHLGVTAAKYLDAEKEDVITVPFQPGGSFVFLRVSIEKKT